MSVCRRSLVISVLLGVLWAGCAAQTARPPAAHQAAAVPAPQLDYVFTLDAALRTLQAQVCFSGPLPARLVSGLQGGGVALSAAWHEDLAGARAALPVEDGAIVLDGLPPGACIAYAIDFDALHDAHGFAVQRRQDSVATNIALWLFRPVNWDRPAQASARFVLPAGMRVSVPWSQRGGGYALDASAFAFYAYAAFGAFELESIDVAGAQLQVAVLDGLSSETRAHVVPWLRHAATLAAQPFGRFPRARAQVVVVSAGERRGSRDEDDEPVPYGTVTRGGGASALMLLAPRARLDALLADWVAVHEFSHLLHPFLCREDAWLSEGIATFYQEVLRVRAGAESESEAWRRLHEGVALGRDGAQGLSQRSATMMSTHSFALVYWGGAAFALLTDLELRRQSGGRQCLDSVLQVLSERASAQARCLSARELIAQLDDVSHGTIFGSAQQTWVLGSRFPKLDELDARLGVRVQEGAVRLDAHASEMGLREALMHSASCAR